MKQTWYIGKILFENNVMKRLILFDYMVKSIMMYGVEFWGWEERKDLEEIQERYIRWCLELDRCTPGYMAREECKRDKLRIEAGVRCLKFEEKVRSNVKQKLFIACWKEISKQERETSRWTEMRRDY